MIKFFNGLFFYWISNKKQNSFNVIRILNIHNPKGVHDLEIKEALFAIYLLLFSLFFSFYRKSVDIYFGKKIATNSRTYMYSTFRKKNLYAKNCVGGSLGSLSYFLLFWKCNFRFCLPVGIKFKFYVICGWIAEYDLNFMNCN